MSLTKMILLIFTVNAILQLAGHSTSGTMLDTAPTTPQPTLPPPTRHDCCQFEDDVCALRLTNFYWSSQSTPPAHVPYPTGNFIWTNAGHGELTSWPQRNVTSSTTFSFRFFNEGPTCAGSFYFRDSETLADKFLNSLTGYSSTGWMSSDVDCSTCCHQFPCDGQILLTTECDNSSYVLALDNIGRDHSCEEVSFSWD